ncbi:hypothetical protein PV350_33860 [Streptomyces sp. PA03-6a]|nr:hypothetical protein [Streptomyces sp. PA03-6a]
MPQIRPGRVRTKRNNGRAPLRLSKVEPQDVNIREGEVKSIVCPDCKTWRRLMGGNMTLKIREHSTTDQERCAGSLQVIKLDMSVEEWDEKLLAADSTARVRRSARQHYKPLPAPPKPVARMVPVPATAAGSLTAYREHLAKCRASSVASRCAGTHRCADGARLAALYEQLQRTQEHRDRTRQAFARERARFDRRYTATAQKTAAAEWARHREATANARATAKRSGTRVEEANNTCRTIPGAVSEFRGPDVPLHPQRITA